LSPKHLARLASRLLAYLHAAAGCAWGPYPDADEVEWFLSMLSATACTSASSDIMRDLRDRGPSFELPARVNHPDAKFSRKGFTGMRASQSMRWQSRRLGRGNV
jgi:hypothetical protein